MLPVLLICTFILLSKVDKLSQQPHRQAPPNHWSWYQNVRLPGPPGPPGPPPPTRPIHGGSSPSQVPHSLSQPGRRYGPHHNTRSPTSTMLQNSGFPPAQVSKCRCKDNVSVYVGCCLLIISYLLSRKTQISEAEALLFQVTQGLN